MTQKTLLAITQQICGELGSPIPSTVITSSDANVQKILAFIRAACDDLTYDYDWNFLQQRYTFNTVANQETYAWPSDYVRALNGTFFDATNRWPIMIMTPTQWEILNIWNLTASPFVRMRVFNGTMNFFPVPTSVVTFVFDYISANHVLDGNTGNPKADFTQDSDVCLFDARLITYAAKYKFYSATGNDTTAVLADYERVLSLLKGADTPTPRLSLAPRTVHLIDNSNLPDGSWNTAP